MLYPRETDHFSNDAKAVPLGVGSVSFLPDSTLSSLSVPIWILGAWHIVGAASVPQRVNAWMCILCRCAQESQFPPKCIPGKNRNLHKHFWFLNGGFLMLLKEISPTSAASPPRVHLSHWNLLLLALSGVRGCVLDWSSPRGRDPVSGLCGPHRGCSVGRNTEGTD